MRPLQMGKAQRDRGWDEYAVQEHGGVGAGGGCCVCQPLGEAPGPPPTPSVSWLLQCTAWYTDIPAPRAA